MGGLAGCCGLDGAGAGFSLACGPEAMLLLVTGKADLAADGSVGGVGWAGPVENGGASVEAGMTSEVGAAAPERSFGAAGRLKVFCE